MKNQSTKIFLAALILITSTNLAANSHHGEAELCKGVTKICVSPLSASSSVTEEELETCKNCCKSANSTVSMATSKINFCGKSCIKKCQTVFRKKGGKKPSPTPSPSSSPIAQ